MFRRVQFNNILAQKGHEKFAFLDLLMTGTEYSAVFS